jgi:hypothetical protein
MYCINCGLQLKAEFCAVCGTRAVQPEETREATSAGDWKREIRYAVLLYFPEVRDRLAAVPECAKSISGEQWLDLAEKAFNPLGGVSVKTVAAIAAPLYAKMGIKTGKARSAILDAPPGEVMVEVLCALRKHGLPLVNVHQGESGCVFEAKLPSDFWAFEGQVVVTIECTGTQTKVDAATNIPGQLFDWGKSMRYLDAIFGDLRTKAA